MRRLDVQSFRNFREEENKQKSGHKKGTLSSILLNHAKPVMKVVLVLDPLEPLGEEFQRLLFGRHLARRLRHKQSIRY